jgi:hypothetical protein
VETEYPKGFYRNSDAMRLSTFPPRGPSPCRTGFVRNSKYDYNTAQRSNQAETPDRYSWHQRQGGAREPYCGCARPGEPLAGLRVTVIPRSDSSG